MITIEILNIGVRLMTKHRKKIGQFKPKPLPKCNASDFFNTHAGAKKPVAYGTANNTIIIIQY